MNENTKKVGAVILVVLAIVVAGYSAFHFFSGSDEKMKVEKTIAMPPGFKSEKQKAIEEQEKAKSAATGANTPAANPPAERDLGGDIGPAAGK